jgi:glycine/D-amino acid oxidase-like deaminating enzyme
MAGVDLPLLSELHLKVAFKDHLGVIPRDAPMTIWSDTQQLDWSAEERAELESMGRHDVVGEMPVYCHFRPEGGEGSPYILALWEYHDQILEPVWPLPEDPLYPEVVMRGLTTMVPGLDVYAERLPESFVDGGYYTKTVENRPLVGPAGPDGVFLLCAFSGFGIMVSAGAADLLALHLTGRSLPSYSDAFLLDRYEDPGYVAAIESVASGQL